MGKYPGGYLSIGPSISIIEPTDYAVEALYYWRPKNLFHRDECSSSGSGEVPEVPEYLKYRKAFLK